MIYYYFGGREGLYVALLEDAYNAIWCAEHRVQVEGVSPLDALRELVQYVADVLGVKRRIVGLNDALSYLQAHAMEFLPIKLMSRDNIASMEIDSVSQAPFPAVFDFAPTAIETVVPYYLTNESPRNMYNRFRGAAGR